MQLANPYAWVLLVSAHISIVCMAVIWGRRAANGVRAMLAFLAGVALWSLGSSLELFSTQLDAMLAWELLEFLGAVAAPVAWSYFCLTYTLRGQEFVFREHLFLLIEPLVVVLSLLTNDLHHFFYQAASVTEVGGLKLLAVVPGPIYWLNAAYTYLIMGISTLILLRRIAGARPLYQGQVRMMLVALGAPWLGNLVYMLRLSPFDLTPLGFVFTGAVISISITRYKLFNIIPSARGQLVERLDDPVLIVDDQNLVLDANQAARRMFSPTGGDLAGLPVETVFLPWAETLQPYLEQAEARAEVRLDGPRWYDLRISALYPGAGGPLLGRLMVFNDITARRQLEVEMAAARGQAEQASLLKNQLLANVSQELRTPLNVILGYTEMFLEGNFGPLLPEQEVVVRRQLTAAQQMSIAVGDLLDQTLLDQGNIELARAQFSPEQLLASVQSMLSPAVEAKGLELRLRVEPDLPATISGDVKRLRQIILNLAHNAVKFTQEGWVQVRLYREGPESWGIEVSDSGLGIPKEAQAYIFEPFRQGEHTFGRYAGSGLGLSVVRHLVALMGGRIEVRSHLGLGSTFRVVLPMPQSTDF